MAELREATNIKGWDCLHNVLQVEKRISFSVALFDLEAEKKNIGEHQLT